MANALSSKANELPDLTLARSSPHYDGVKLPRGHIIHLGLVVCSGFLLMAAAISWTLPAGGCRRQGQLQSNLAAHVWNQHGVRVLPRDIVLPGPAESGLRPREAYFLGRRAGGHHDVFFVHVIHSGSRVPVHTSPVFSLSRTRTADEALLRYDARRYLAYASMVGGKTSVITVLDLQGLSLEAMDTFTPLQRVLQRLTNWQETGTLRGLDRLEVRLPFAQKLSLSWSGSKLRVEGRSGLWRAVVDPATARVLSGPVVARKIRVGSRSFIGWAVDSVRGLSFVGPAPIAWLEDQVYGLVDSTRRMSGSEISASEIKDEMSLPVVSSPASSRIQGWPPAPLRPMLPRSLPGEGKWMEVSGPFVRSKKGSPQLFAMTFLRPDAERLFARVYFVAWDPRRVELRVRPGTREPRSATGNRGDGMIPRKRAVLGRLVGAFNGGFQSVNGDFGMMVDRKAVAPAKPWAATVARLADGSTGFGTWDGKSRHGWAPPWMVSFRQNLTALVEDGKVNPWKRVSWGSAPGGHKGPSAYIVRSGLCLHRSGHVMYVYGDPVDGKVLGKTMQHAGCIYGIQLDINRGHTGMEFYNVRLPDEAPPPGADKFKVRRQFSASGSYPKMKGLSYYMRELVRGTGNRCPRWVYRDARDFFYLLERDMLPGADLAPLGGVANEGRWTVASLPRAATTFPQAMARTFVQPDKKRVHVIKLDLRWLDTRLCVPEEGGDCLASQGTGGVLAVLPLGAFGGGRAMVADGKPLLGSAGSRHYLTVEPLRPGGPALPSVTSSPDPDRGSISIQGADPAARPTGSGTASAVCALPGGRLAYATGLGATAEHLRKALSRAGCDKEVIFLGAASPLVLGSSKSVRSTIAAFPPVAESPSLVFRRSTARWGSRIFTHVKVQPHWVWRKVQPEATRGTRMRQVRDEIKRLGLGLPNIKDLKDLCSPPYSEVPELRKLRWKDPVTGRGLCKKKPGKQKTRN